MDRSSDDARAQPALALEVEDDGLARLLLDGSGGYLTRGVLRRLDERLGEVEALAAEGRLSALVVRGATPGVFLRGFDPAELRAAADAREGTALALEGQRVLRRLERLGVPSIAAVDGECMGAGAELALACAYRLGSDAAHTRLGLPQIRHGLIPALGGTVRLPRLIGVQAALSLILSGDPVGAREAKRLGLLDEVFPAGHFESRVDDFARERVRRGRTRTGARRGVARRLLEDTFPGRRLLFSRVARQLRPRGEETLAARRALEAVAEGVALPLERAFEREAEMMGELLASESARALLHASRLLERAARPAPPTTAPVEQAAVLGAGRAGVVAAHLLAASGVSVRLKDRRHGAVTRGVARVAELLRAQAEQGGGPAREREGRGARIAGGMGFGGFGTLDLVVAALEDDPAAAESALLEAEEHTEARCLLAATAPTLSLEQAQERSGRPGSWLGLHLAEPTDRVTLMEIAITPRTDAAAVAALQRLARRMGRTPLVVADRPGRVLPRLLGVYFAEATRMLDEGATVQQIDGALEDFGMLAGPFRRMDAFGLDRAAALLRGLEEAFGERMLPGAWLSKLVRPAERDEPGTFYQYRNGRAVRVNPALPRGEREPATARAIEWRLLLLLLDEAVRVLDEGVVPGPDELDLATLTGLGFPSVRGGLLHWADRQGVDQIVQRLDELADRLGERFRPAERLRRLAAERAALHAGSSGHAAPPVLS